MKSHRRSISPENPFNFIKIILSDDTQSRGIRLPQKFTEEYGKYLSQSVTLKVPNGDVWRVEVQKTGDEIWLKNGWGRFAEHYGLGLSHLLMFEYDGLSTFGVIIFNATASEIKYPKNTDRNAGKCHVSCDEQETVILDDDDDDDHMCSSSEDGKNGVKINDEGECSRKRQGGGRKQALEKAKENFKSDLPFFMVYMSTSYLTNRGVSVQAEFRRKLLRDNKNYRECLLLLEDDGKMKTYKVVAQNRFLGKADWRMFVEDNGIEVGDVCVFELIHKDKNVLAVTIFRSGT